MSTKIIDEYVERIYDFKTKDLEENNDAFERDYFGRNYYRIPNGDLLKGLSFNDNLRIYKEVARDCSLDDLNTIFESLRDFFFFSAGNDMIYREKLKADSYRDVPIKDFILPIIQADAHNKYTCDEGFHPARRTVINTIDSIVNNGIIMSTFLYFLYCDDFIPRAGMKRLFPSSYNRVIEKLSNLPITIGDYLRALVDFKCEKIKSVFEEVSNKELKNEMMQKIEELRQTKYDEIKELYNSNLQICYFFNHTVHEYINSTLCDTNKMPNEKNLVNYSL